MLLLFLGVCFVSFHHCPTALFELPLAHPCKAPSRFFSSLLFFGSDLFKLKLTRKPFGLEFFLFAHKFFVAGASLFGETNPLLKNLDVFLNGARRARGECQFRWQ